MPQVSEACSSGPTWAMALGLGLAAGSCGGQAQGLAELPTPETVTKDDPGGDAPDPQGGALLRLLQEPLHTVTDKPKTVRVDLADGRHWRRVRIWGLPTRVAFRYGDDHYAIAAVFYSEAEPGDTPDTCLQRFVARGRAMAKVFGLESGPLSRQEGFHHPRQSVLGPAPPPPDAQPGAEPEQRRVDKPMPLIRVEAESTALDAGRWIGAAASYHLWPGRCLVQAFTVDADEHPELAAAVVERWVKQAAGRLVWTPSLWEAPPIENR